MHHYEEIWTLHLKNAIFLTILAVDSQRYMYIPPDGK